MRKIYDFIGIGIGPYNLSFAALTEDIASLDGLFFEETEKLNWHPGMLIDGMDLQTPFYADLVTFADPTNKYSFLNYLHKKKRLYPFFFYREMEVPRQEYNDYLQWAARQMTKLQFGKRVVDVVDKGDHYEVSTEDVVSEEVEHFAAKHILLATGAEPVKLSGVEEESADVIHTENYLYHKEPLLKANSLVVIGSGQSAAEVFLDLLKEREGKQFHLSWLTRSEGIFQKETTKLAREFYSPEYTSYYHQLPLDERKKALATLSPLHSEIDASIINEIYNELYEATINDSEVKITIQPMTEVSGIEKNDEYYLLNCNQWQSNTKFNYQAEKVIFATGYKPRIPDWFNERFKEEVEWEADKLFKVGRNYDLQFKDDRKHRFYSFTNIEHSHSVSATSLAVASQRSMDIINHLLGETYFEQPTENVFQQFFSE